MSSDARGTVLSSGPERVKLFVPVSHISLSEEPVHASQPIMNES